MKRGRVMWLRAKPMKIHKNQGKCDHNEEENSNA
jgi:hypothetical protein